MIPCEILSWLEIVYLTFTSSSKFLRLTNFHQSIELKMTFVSIYFKSSWSDWSSFMTLITQRKLLSKKLPSSSLPIVQLCKSGFVRVPVFPWQFITRAMLQVGAAQKSNWKLNQYCSMDEQNSCSIIIFDWYELWLIFTYMCPSHQLAALVAVTRQNEYFGGWRIAL